MRVEVTAEDIAMGQASRIDSCPIALAFKRVKPDAEHVSVFNESISWGEGEGVDGRMDLPREAEGFIQRFDGRKPVEPFAFDAEPRYPWRKPSPRGDSQADGVPNTEGG